MYFPESGKWSTFRVLIYLGSVMHSNLNVGKRSLKSPSHHLSSNLNYELRGRAHTIVDNCSSGLLPTSDEGLCPKYNHSEVGAFCILEARRWAEEHVMSYMFE